jgi:hypothetical protein
VVGACGPHFSGGAVESSHHSLPRLRYSQPHASYSLRCTGHGRVGQGALRECLLAGDVEHVLCVGRRPTGQTHPKLKELVLSDFHDFGPVADRLAGYDACFFCLGVTSVGMSEADYRRVTRDIAAAAARVLVQENPGMTFIIVTGRGTDSTGTSATMWARVKGDAELVGSVPETGSASSLAVIEPSRCQDGRTTSACRLSAVQRRPGRRVASLLHRGQNRRRVELASRPKDLSVA